MSGGQLLVWAAVLLFLPLDQARAEAENLVALVRRLTAIQSSVVAGDADAKEQSATQLRQIEQMLAGLSPEALQDEQNLREIALFLLAGGSPTVVRKLFSDNVLDEKNAPLVAAALAFAEGRRKEATSKLGEIKEQEYSHRLGGHIALVKGGLLLGVDKQRAAQSLDWARLMMPGSLVEEAALRRLVVALDFAEDEQRYLMLVRRYARVYPRSPFADSFKKFVLKQALDSAMKLNESSVDGLAAALALESQRDALEWRLGVMRKMLLAGKVDLAAKQFPKAEQLANAVGVTGRMNLYGATIKAMEGKVEQSELELANVDKASLTPEEQTMTKVVGSILRRLNSPTIEQAVDGASQAPARAPALIESPVVLSAQKSLDAADTILKRRNNP